jgi:hypothetical protein
LYITQHTSQALFAQDMITSMFPASPIFVAFSLSLPLSLSPPLFSFLSFSVHLFILTVSHGNPPPARKSVNHTIVDGRGELSNNPSSASRESHTTQQWCWPCRWLTFDCLSLLRTGPPQAWPPRPAPCHGISRRRGRWAADRQLAVTAAERQIRWPTRGPKIIRSIFDLRNIQEADSVRNFGRMSRIPGQLRPRLRTEATALQQSLSHGQAGGGTTSTYGMMAFCRGKCAPQTHTTTGQG